MTDFMNYNFNITKIILACYVSRTAGERFHKNRQSHGLAFHISGEKTYIFDNGKSFDVCKNKIIYLPKRSNYELERRIRGECYAINFELDEDTDFEPFAVNVKNSDRLLSLFKGAQQLWKIKERGYEMECKANLYHILRILQQEAALSYMPNEKAQIIAPAVECLREHYADGELSIARLSEICGITPEYFRKIFKSIYGTSPLAYINSQRLIGAKELIDSGMYSVTEAAEASGYNDLSHFSRAFKTAFGISAREYKNARN